MNLLSVAILINGIGMHNCMKRKLCILPVIITIVIINFLICAQAEELDFQIVTIPGKPVSPTPAFSESGNATLENPWVLCDQYIVVIHTPVDEAMPPNPQTNKWFVRMITNNKSMPGLSDMACKILGIGPGPDKIPGTNDDTWGAGPDGKFGTADDVWGKGPDNIPGTIDDTINVSYNGLIDSATKKNPDNRAVVVWQVYPASQTIDYGALKDTLDDDYINANYWAYLCDMSDSGFVRYQAGLAGYTDEYFRIASGLRFTSGVIKIALAPYPKLGYTRWILPDADGKFRVKVFLGACFGRDLNYSNPGALVPGNYGSSIWLQLYHE